MPRRAAADIGFLTSTTTRLKPPDDLTGPEREVFLSTVLACSADHFRQSDLSLLVAYCAAVVRERTASGELAAAGYVVDGRPSPWAGLLKDAVRDLTVISRLLRLTPLARTHQATPSKEPDVQVSAYERMALEAARDGRN